MELENIVKVREFEENGETRYGFESEGKPFEGVRSFISAKTRKQVEAYLENARKEIILGYTYRAFGNFFEDMNKRFGMSVEDARWAWYEMLGDWWYGDIPSREQIMAISEPTLTLLVHFAAAEDLVMNVQDFNFDSAAAWKNRDQLLDALRLVPEKTIANLAEQAVLTGDEHDDKRSAAVESLKGYGQYARLARLTKEVNDAMKRVLRSQPEGAASTSKVSENSVA
jgi:hypothetical protein